MRGAVFRAYRRRVAAICADLSSGRIFQSHPGINLADVYWLANDTQYFGLLRPHEALEMLSLEPLIKSSMTQNGVKTVVGGGDDEDDDSRRWSTLAATLPIDDVLRCLRAISTLPVDQRNTPRVASALKVINLEVLRRMDVLSAKTAASIIKQVPTLSMTIPSTAAMVVQLCNTWMGRLGEMPHPNDARAFLQTIGSQLTRAECADSLSKLNMTLLNSSIEVFLTRRNELRRVGPTILVTLSKLHGSGLPLSPLFVPALNAYMDHVVRRSQLTVGEALRVLYAICRVRMIQKALVFHDEGAELMGIVSRDVAHLDGAELGMLMHCLAYNFTDYIQVGAKAAKSSSSPSSTSSASGGKPIALWQLTSKMATLFDVISLRGFLSCCRSASMMGFAHGCSWDDRLCEAVVRRCAALVLNEPPAAGALTSSRAATASGLSSGAPLFEKLTVLVAANAFAAKTLHTRQTIHRIVSTLVQHYPHELTATNLSMIFSSLAWTFGVAVGSGEIQTSPSVPISSGFEVRSRCLAHEIDPVLLSALIDKAVVAPRLSQYVYSSLLRSFCRLGIEYPEVAGVVRRMLTMRNDNRRHSRAEVEAVRSGVSMGDDAMDATWFGRQEGYLLMSAHMSEIVLASTVSLGCTDSIVNAYIGWTVVSHNDGVVPERLQLLWERVSENNPLLQSLGVGKTLVAASTAKELP